MINSKSRYWSFPSVQGAGNPKDRLDEKNHRARFPVTLPWRCMKILSDAGDIVIDPFSGTSTTIIAAEQLDRRCFAIERDTAYCDISAARYHKFVPDAEIFLVREGEIIPFKETGLKL